jgi:competence protein ComEC
LWVCIWRGRQRWLGVPAVVAGLLTVALVRGPDVLVAGDARLMAVRGADGGLAFSTEARGNSMVRDSWLRRDANDETDPWPTSGVSADGRLACDWRGCVYTARGQVVAIARRAEALPDDCRYATVMIATFGLGRRPCAGPGLTIDRTALVRDGGHAVWLAPDGAVAQSVRASRGDRPWVQRPPARTQPPAPSPAAASRAPARPTAGDDAPAED